MTDLQGKGADKAWSLLWFRSRDDVTPFINDTAVRIRAGIMLAIPIFMAFTLWDIVFGSRWIVTGEVIKDTFELDFDNRILYMVEAVRRTYDYTVQTWLLFYALFEMLAGMSVKTAYLSPTIWLSTLLARKARPLWKPLAPKRFAWTIGASMISVCLVFFHHPLLWWRRRFLQWSEIYALPMLAAKRFRQLPTPTPSHYAQLLFCSQH